MQFMFKQYYIDYLKFINQQLKIYKKINIIQFEENIKENNIICEYMIKKEYSDKEGFNRQILNCYEEVKKLYSSEKGIENEKDLRDNYELYLNNERINFCVKYNFLKEGKYIIKIMCKKPLFNINHMFCYCSSLTYLDLSNFITNNVKDMFYN